MMTTGTPTTSDADAKFETLLEAILFLVRHVPVPNLADAFIADLHRASIGNEPRLKVVNDLAYRLRERNEFIADSDA